MPELAKTYDPSSIEQKWYSLWEEAGYFHADETSSKPPFTIVMPPPNVTGSLTLGHVLNHTIQDLYIRWHRMNGFESCWMPGMDHAGIATQAVVEKKLAEEKITRHDLGREKFVDKVWEWKRNYGGLIATQLRRLGNSSDWAREKFTLDADMSAAVREAFVRLFEAGLIYRGKRIINWDPKLLTALSDEEVEHKQRNGKLWHFKYPVIENGTPSATQFITVATTRPETMLGDTAVAVNPADARYTALVGKRVLLPLMNREIPIIADAYVDASFGTGAVKVTPAHDPNDFEMGQRHALASICVMHPTAVMNEHAGAYEGMDRYAARKKVVADMEALGFVAKIEDYTNNVGVSQRSGEVIEPYLSDQWFVKMAPLAERALRVVAAPGDEFADVRSSMPAGHGVNLAGEAVPADELIHFHPEHWAKTYRHWMTNVRDWCISRQLWWGHRIPVWYCVGDDHCTIECKNPIVSRTPVEKCPHCGSTNLRQDEDVLDTWFSSWLWPLSVFGWPAKTAAFEKFYPTSLLSTGADIIFFWVARMIIAGLEFTEPAPLQNTKPVRVKLAFRDVYFHNIIRDAQGRKLSKSLGNSPDPIAVMDQYGTDALRFTILYIAPMGQDVLFDVAKCEIGRNFANKIWNAARFLMLKRDEAHGGDAFGTDVLQPSAMELADRWILSRFTAMQEEMRHAIATFDVNAYTKIMYDFVWHDFCDVYVEIVKNRLARTSDVHLQRALTGFAIGVYENALLHLHPVMPFITEEIWQTLRTRTAGETIMTRMMPAIDATRRNDKAEREMTVLMNLVERLRQLRNENNVPPGKQLTAVARVPDAVRNPANSFLNAAWLVEHKTFVEELTRVAIAVGDATAELPKIKAASVVDEIDLFLSLEGLIDVDKEKSRLAKEIDRLRNLHESTGKKLANPSFADRAPKDVVEKERAKMASFVEAIAKLEESLSLLGK